MMRILSLEPDKPSWPGGSTPMSSNRRISTVALALGLVAALTFFSTSQVSGQRIMRGKRPWGGVEPPANPTTPTTTTGFTDGITHEKMSGFNKGAVEGIQAAIKAKAWAEAIKALQGILDNPKSGSVEVTRKNAKTG